MTKRKISQQQERRIKAKQEEVLSTDALWGLVLAQFGQNLEIEDSDGKIFECKKRQNLDPIVAGDNVRWQLSTNSTTGVVLAILPRKSLLSRPDNRGNLHAVAANIDQMYIMIAPEPAPNLTTVDRYLLGALSQNIEPIIVLNKEDLLPDSSNAQITDLLKTYQRIGVKTLVISAKRLQHLSQLHESMQNKVSVFVGQSGVGKSSVIATLLPHHEIKIGEISAEKKLGKHTTTTARLYHVDGLKAAIIDSPGMREFPLWKLEPASLALGFVEFIPFIENCKYRNCVHQNEPGCAVLEAVAEGKISPTRLASYHEIFKQMQTQKQ